MLTTFNPPRITVAAIVLAAVVGCGSEEDNYALVPVKGTVTQNGKPMVGASISFVPDVTNEVSTPGIDATGPDGSYLLRFKNRTGVAPGKYKVTITPALDTGTAKVPEAFKDDPYMAQLSLSGGGVAEKKGARGEKSEFDAEVPEGGDVFDFDVKTATK